MARTGSARRPSAGVRRTGYMFAIAFGVAFLIVLNGWPGWQAMPFLTAAASQVIWLVNVSLAAGIAANIVYLAYDPPGLKAAGDLVTTGIGLAAAIRVWQVFPFDFRGSGAWGVTARALLIVAIAGSCIALVVQLVQLVRALAGHAPGSGHPRTGH